MLQRRAWLPAAVVLLSAACAREVATHGSTSSGGEGGSSTTSSSGGSPASTASSASSSSTSSASTGSTSSSSSSGTGGSGDAGADGADASDGAMFGCAVEGVPGNCMDTTACAAMPNHASTAGLCPGPANVECCTPFGAALCDPAAMPRPAPNAGNTTEAPGEGGCPDGMLAVTTFCVDKYEATLVRMDNGEAWCPFDNPGSTAVRAVSVEGAVPQAYIDGLQAGQACANAGKRLCTDAEWLRACQGPSADTYPYGNTLEPGVCNDHRAEHPAVEYFGTTASWIYTMLENSCLDQLPETVDLTGSLTGCVTAEGAHDMMGNVHEWTADPAGTFRGGYFMDTVINGPGCLYATTAHDTSYWDYSTGFRCCAD